jgi:hypothetical protein
LHKGGGLNDWNAKIGVKDKQIGIAGNDKIGLPILMASSRNLSSVGSRQAAIRSLIVMISAAANNFVNHSRVVEEIRVVNEGRAITSNSCRSVAEDFKRTPRCSTMRTAIAGNDLSFNAALIKTLVSTTTLISRVVRLRVALS